MPTYEEIRAAEAAERQVAQRWTLDDEHTRQAFIRTFPPSTARQCLQYGLAVNWQRLPAEVRVGYAKRIAEWDAEHCERNA